MPKARVNQRRAGKILSGAFRAYRRIGQGIGQAKTAKIQRNF
jgi:hypothetical protein